LIPSQKNEDAPPPENVVKKGAFNPCELLIDLIVQGTVLSCVDMSNGETPSNPKPHAKDAKLAKETRGE
jgi:hypothetical protein